MKAKLINNIGNLHKSFGNFDEALKLFEESLKILTVWEDKITYIVVLENLGELYMKKNEIEKALEYLNKGISMIGGLIPSVESSSLTIRSEIYLKQGKIKECLEDCLKTVEIIEETKVDFQRGRIYITVAKCLIKMSDSEKEENKSLIDKISELSNTPVLPEKFFKKAISRSKNPMFAEVNIPALYEYALFLYNTNNTNNALSILKDAYQLSVKYGLTSEKTIIENIAKEYKLDVK
jgi:tetratricopeptide (TPR) repeat protein